MAKPFAEIILSDTENDYAADAAAVLMLNAMGQGNLDEANAIAERMATLTEEGIFMHDEGLYQALMEYLGEA